MAEGNSFCEVCGRERVFQPGGTSRKTGKPYNASYRCSTPQCTGQVVWLSKQYGATPGPPERPVAAPRGPVGPDVRDRTIAAQTCVKAACEAVSALCATRPASELKEVVVHEWVVRLAQRLYNDVVGPAMGAPRLDVWGHKNEGQQAEQQTEDLR